jgi:hypothetical protein
MELIGARVLAAILLLIIVLEFVKGMKMQVLGTWEDNFSPGTLYEACLRLRGHSPPNHSAQQLTRPS